MPPRVAAITMAFDESVLLPIWARHYARQVGADQCFVVDHGSTSLPQLPPGVNVLRIPRSAHDDSRRARFVSGLASTLLGYFDWVLYTDVDELLLADPALFPNLPAFCAATPHPVVTAIGLDIQHVPSLEPPLDPATATGLQRGWVRFTSAMCKPALTRVPVRWDPGFHGADTPTVFAPLYLFHLHWVDRDLGLQRLAKTRVMPWPDTDAGAHQRVADQEWCRLFDGMAALPRRKAVRFAATAPPIASWLERVQASRQPSQPPDLHINAAELWPIPPHFRARL